MLEELQGAGLGWDHPYVQCRIQGSLYSMQKQIQLPPNLCANLAPTDVERIDALAFVRFMPPDDEYAGNKLTYPPLKKHNVSPAGGGINTIFHQLQLQDRQQRNDPQEMLGEFDRHRESQMNPANVMDMFLENERARIQKEQAEREAELEAQQKEALRNRLELYQMLAASEPDPQPYQRNSDRVVDQHESIPMPPAAPIYVPDEPNDSNELYFPENYGPYKRTSARKGVEKNQPDRRSFFRELAQEKGMEQETPLYSHVQVQQPLTVDVMPTFKRRPTPVDDDDFRIQSDIDESLFRNSLTPLEEEAMLASNIHPHRHKQHRPERVYTEGGLITMDEQQALGNEYSKERRKEKARELLANMLGFTRHERLDVKKPGPMVGPPPFAKEDLEVKSANINNNTETKEKLPAHIKSSNEANKKKKVVKNHSDEDHAPHTVDTEYAHVFVKNP